MGLIKIYTDGACKGNPGPGGWGVLVLGDPNKHYSGYEAATTNNRMELMAVIQGLDAMPEGSDIAVYTDSKYVCDGISSWIKGWKSRGWLTASRKPVKNQDLWKRLDAARARHTVSWHWVKGHSGVPENEFVDKLANDAIANHG